MTFQVSFYKQLEKTFFHLHGLCKFHLCPLLCLREQPRPMPTHVGVFHIKLPPVARLHCCNGEGSHRASFGVFKELIFTQNFRPPQITAPCIVFHRSDNLPYLGTLTGQHSFFTRSYHGDPLPSSPFFLSLPWLQKNLQPIYLINPWFRSKI